MRNTSIGELTTAVATWNPSRAPKGVFEYIDLSAVDNVQKVITGTTSTSCAAAPSRARQLVAAGDVLVSTVRPNLNAVAVVPQELDGATASTGFTVLRPGPALDSRFLFHWVRSPLFVQDMVRKATGASYPAVSDRIVMESAIPRYSVEEQRRIASILDCTDALHAKGRLVVSQLDALQKSILASLLASERWPLADLASQLAFLTSGSRGWAKYYSPSGDKFIRIQNVKGGYLSEVDMAFVEAPDTAEAKRTLVQPGDVLLSITADLGRTAVVPSELGVAYINQHLAILRAPGLEPRFLADFLESPAGRREVLGKDRGATKAGLNFDDVRSVSIPVPPRDVQRQYALRIDALDRQRAMHQLALRAHDELFASLQARAFRGEL